MLRFFFLSITVTSFFFLLLPLLLSSLCLPPHLFSQQPIFPVNSESDYVILLLNTPLLPVSFRVKAKVFTVAHYGLVSCHFSDFLSGHYSSHSFCFSMWAALQFLQHTKHISEPSHGGFFYQDALSLDVPVTSSSLYAHDPLRWGLSPSQPTPFLPPPKRLYSLLLLTFLNVTYNHVTDYLFYIC